MRHATFPENPKGNSPRSLRKHKTFVVSWNMR